MALTTTTSAAGTNKLLQGTAQEVLDALDAEPRAAYVQFGHDGAGFYALVRK